jgi:hypothetical protein
MNVDAEAGGALATASLAAQAIELQQGGCDAAHSKICANCNTPLLGAYCHACGQTAHVHRSLWHMLEEALHGVLHFDSKSWRTLPLLIARPGELTRRYIDGQRVRYVSPLALFLFSIFLMFFVVSLVSHSTPSLANVNSPERAEAHAAVAAQYEAVTRKVAELEAALAAADADKRAELERELVAARSQQRTAAAALVVFENVVDGDTEQSPGDTFEKLRTITGWEPSAGTNAALNAWQKNPELQLYKLRNTAYKFSFMLIPISLPFLWLMFFWRKNVTLYDHMVFSMYSLSFMSLLFVVVALLGTTQLTSKLQGALLLVPPVHMYVHLRGTYGLSRGSALWRTLALLASAGTVFIVFLVFAALVSST